MLVAQQDDREDEAQSSFSNRFYTQKKYGANTTYLWLPQSQFYFYNDIKLKYESNGSLI